MESSPQLVAAPVRSPLRRGASMRVVRSDRRGGEVELWIEGAFDAFTVHDINPDFDAIVAEAPRLVVVDLDGVTMLDSRGVGAILSLWKRVRAQGGKVDIVHAHDQPLAVLRVLKLDAVFGIGRG